MVDCALCGLRVAAFRPSSVPGLPGREWFPRPHVVRVTIPAQGLLAGTICRGQYQPGAQPTAAPWVPVPCRWTLPYPVGSRAGGGISVNHQYRPSGGGARVLSDVAATWRDEVIMIVRRSGAVAPRGPLGLAVLLVPPDGRVRDTDGPIKLIADALADGLELNDRRIADVAVRRAAPNPARPRIVV